MAGEPGGPTAGIDRLTIRGVDASVAAVLETAIARALSGRSWPQAGADLGYVQLRLPHGATAADIAAALAAAITRG